MTNSLALSAGNEAVQGYFSFTNTLAKGIVEGNDLKRNNFNVRLTSKMSKRLTLDTKVTYFNQEVDNRVSSGDDYYNSMRAYTGNRAIFQRKTPVIMSIIMMTDF